MLTDISIKGLKARDKQYKVSDEKGLFLLVKPNGSKLWRLKYYLHAVERGPLALGSYPEVSLKRAREKRDAARSLLDAGIDPAMRRREEKAAVQRARAAHVTVQRSVVTLTQEAIRVCGGRGMLKRYPLERYARDARAAALMRPWTQDIATQQAWEFALGIGVGAPQPTSQQ